MLLRDQYIFVKAVNEGYLHQFLVIPLKKPLIL